jgi:HicA toxin of bacterial toxin-antitoxin,
VALPVSLRSQGKDAVAWPISRGLPKVLTGEDLIAIFQRFGFIVIGGSKHIKLQRTTPAGHETLVIPRHNPIAKGTLRAILSQAARYIPQSELRPHFYNE